MEDGESRAALIMVTRKPPRREKERQRHRKIGRQRQKVGKRGRKRKGDGREKTGLVA